MPLYPTQTYKFLDSQLAFVELYLNTSSGRMVTIPGKL
jgi:hypothetical protein